jgi:hypothetical protein
MLAFGLIYSFGMKNMCFIFLLLLWACDASQNETRQEVFVPKQNSPVMFQLQSNKQKTGTSQYYTTKDTISIITEFADTLKFSKTEFNNIVDHHPEFFNDFPGDPDKLYYCYNKDIDFASEQGQDSYYVLYAYFLKHKNGDGKYALQRKKLIDIYTDINSLFARFQYGGTYFGHQRVRILGYAEYSIYLYPKNKNDIEKTYNISKQKELYINSLRQLIADESKIDYESVGKYKVERTKMLNKIVDELNLLITDNFYLRRAQEFHYRHYEYY